MNKRITKFIGIALVLAFSISHSNAQKSNTSILGKVICGYQGWFNTKDDGANLGWKHLGKAGKFEPGFCTNDYWPDLSEFGADEKYPTDFKLADGSQAFAFSSCNPKTVNRHFLWMKTYGIDGVFIQRFVNEMKNPRSYPNMNRIFDFCMDASLKNNRLIGVMYDLSGAGHECADVIIKDWKALCDKHKFNRADSKNYLSHKGKPLVALWGVGFNDNRKYDLNDITKLIRFLKDDPKYGGCSILLGVPAYWRTFGSDCVKDPTLHDVLKMADIIHPWTVGRYHDIAGADHYSETLKGDKLWCDKYNLDYMPVVFPGFSWSNLRNRKSPLNQIPRQKGAFYWEQMYNAVNAGVKTIYVAMFDEMDEGTCIFKCTSNTPVGISKFCDYEGLPSDHYLWLTGQAAKMLKDGQPENTMPVRAKK